MAEVPYRAKLQRRYIAKCLYCKLVFVLVPSRLRYPEDDCRQHDTGVHADSRSTIVDVLRVVARDDVLENKNSLLVSELRRKLTKLPARPPAMRATPMNSTTRARHATEPSEPQESDP